jgi:hypothetical protein
MFIRLSPAQSTGVHGWGSKLKTTLSWKDVEENESIHFDKLMQWDVSTKELKKLQPDVRMWVLHAGCQARHAVQLMDWPAHPIRDLHGDLGDVIALRASSKQLKTMNVTYAELKAVGMTPETMKLMALSLQGWIELGLEARHVQSDFTDAQLARVFNMTRNAVLGCFTDRR